jgi:hypothetical protein
MNVTDPIRRAGRLESLPLGSGIITITFPDGPCTIMPLPTGDLEAAFQATGATDVTAYAAVPGAPSPQAADTDAAARPAFRSFGWARATGPDGTAEAWLQTGESYAFTAAASIRAVEETLARSLSGAFSPAAAFGADFALTIPDTTRPTPFARKRPVPEGSKGRPLGARGWHVPRRVPGYRNQADWRKEPWQMNT